MTFAMRNKINGSDSLNDLRSKNDFDSIGFLNKKPSVVAEGVGYETSNLVKTKLKDDDLDNLILKDRPNLYKQIGLPMSDEGFIKLPRSLLNSDNWRNLTFRHKGLFLYLLQKVKFTTKTYNHHGKDIQILPGQYCVTYRRLVDEYNKTLKFKKEHIDVPFLQRSVSLYDKFCWTDTRSDTGIMIITITYSELSDHFKSLIDTTCDTKTIQDRYTNEERKKGRSIKETIDSDFDSCLINNSKKENIEKVNSVFEPEQKPKVEFSEEKKKHYEILCKYVVQNSMQDKFTPNQKPGIKETDLQSWLKKYEGKEIMECLKITLSVIPQRTWPGYVSQLLKDRIPKKQEDSKNGKMFVQDFIKKYNVKHIEVKKDYFKDLISDEQSYYYLPLITLEAILKRSVERKNEQDREEKRLSDYEDDY